MKNEVKHLKYSFGKVHGFRQCLGAVDVAHVNIKTPKNNSTDFIKRKGHHSINVQACLNYNYHFFDVIVKWPGSVHDARILGNSSINQMLKDGTIPKCFKVMGDGEDPVPASILGDPAYPLLGYLMKEFSSGGTTPEEVFFSYHLSSARMVVEYVLGRLKGRFGILRKYIDTDLKKH